MNRRELVLSLSLVPVISHAQSLSDIAKAVKDPLIGMLTSKLGITDNQAKGGMGSLLSLAKEKMPADNYSKLTSLIPTASSYVDSAKQLGAVTGPLKNMTGLNGALSKLGIPPETVKLFVPTVADYVGKIGGEGAKNMLLAALK
jgi:hypothetical protein